jgi:hypothetical protein
VKYFLTEHARRRATDTLLPSRHHLAGLNNCVKSISESVVVFQQIVVIGTFDKKEPSAAL